MDLYLHWKWRRGSLTLKSVAGALFVALFLVVACVFLMSNLSIHVRWYVCSPFPNAAGNLLHRGHQIDSNTSTDNAPPTTIPKEKHHNTHTQRTHSSEDALCFHAQLTCCDSSHGTLAVKSEKRPGNAIIQLICATVTMQDTSHTRKDKGSPLSTKIRTCMRATTGHRTVHVVCPLAMVQPELSNVQLFDHQASDEAGQYHESCSVYRSQRTPSNIDRCYLRTCGAPSLDSFVTETSFPSVAHERGN